MLWLNYFLLIRGIEFLRASLIFTGRIYNCFFVHNYLTNLNQQWPTTTNKQSTLPLRALAFIYHLKFSRIPNATQPQKLSAAGKIMPLLEHKASHSQLLWSSPTPESKTKTYYYTISVGLFEKICLSISSMWYTIAVFRPTRRQHRMPITDGCEPPSGFSELNSGPLEEQSVLLTAEPSLRAYFCVF